MDHQTTFLCDISKSQHIFLVYNKEEFKELITIAVIKLPLFSST